MVAGEQLMYALEHCKDDCKNCVASIHGKSCKEFESKWIEWAQRQHEEFWEKLRSTK